MPTFTFPSGTTVELPQGMTVCQSPVTVTYDCARVVPVAKTPAGRSVFTSFSCAAYSRAADVLDQRKEVAERERYVHIAASKGRRTDRLTEYLEHHRQVLAWTLAEYESDPAPCSCGT
ncbi:hypothetical protein J7E96_28430 [Streptomyces sp. ISL-96]|uniref:hypothetical protein n=1 Tax=Streptomyces sp. ISL-96 TaxID=2819191 RepID=UPI001BE89CC5|nr:hypothetical protein [Streptomyces sp. ISL-96]MBT2492368.1 hypothetical protein [Streptomyces sp. ISL-96]